MNDQMQEVFETKPKKKKIYKKWWFWVIIGVLAISIFYGMTEEQSDMGSQGAETSGSAETISEEEYKEMCNTYAYKDLARNPENFKGIKIVLSGEVIQVMESGKKLELRVNMDGDYDQTVYVKYTLKNGEGRILEGDQINIYGTFEGLKTYTSVLGAEITLPRIDAKYIELVE